MTTRRKDFDCVEMKDRIQKKLLKEWEGLTDEQIRERIHRHLETSDEPLAVWWRKICESNAAKAN